MNTCIELYEDEWMERVSGASIEALKSVKYNTVKLLSLLSERCGGAFKTYRGQNKHGQDC